MSVAGKRIVITGASRGIGRLLALDLARDGAHVVLAARSAEGLEAVAREVEELGGTAVVVPTDVAQAADRVALIAAAESLGPIDVLINNAGIELPVAVSDLHEGDVDRLVTVNLTASIELTRLVLESMLARGSGAIVLVSSMAGKSPVPFNAVYAATKHGMNGFASSLRIELSGSGVHCGAVCPGFVGETGMWVDSGATVPSRMSEVSPARVIRGVRRVIAGRAEELVMPMPVRPLLALAQLFPALDGMVLRWLGVTQMLGDRAKALAARRASGA